MWYIKGKDKKEEGSIIIALNSIKHILQIHVTAEEIRIKAKREENLKKFIKELKSSEKYQKDGEEIDKLYQDLLDKESTDETPDLDKE